MYFGSVQFFKHLILTVMTLSMLVPAGFAVYFAMDNAQLSEELNALKTENIANLLNAHLKESESLYQYSAATVSEAAYDFDLEYKNLYPDLNVGDIPEQTRETDTIYLTFDDGPSKLTLQVLDVLQEKNVKATFFIVGKCLESEQGKQILKRIVQDGHTVGIHSYSHIYNKIYKSVEAYLDDFYKVYDQIYHITGIKPEVFRFPGGSVNGYSNTVYKEIIAEMTCRGFVYYDWNVSSQDAAGNTKEQQIFDSVITTSKAKTRSIVLMHDSAEKRETLKALPGIIDELTACGYRFESLNRKVAPIIFGYSD